MPLFTSLEDIKKLARPAKGKSYVEAWASFQPGFGIRILPNGMRCWIARYRKPGAKSDTKERLLDVPVDGTRRSFQQAQLRAAQAKQLSKDTATSGGPTITSAYASYLRVLGEGRAADTLNNHKFQLARLSGKARTLPMADLKKVFWTGEWEMMKKTTDSGARATLRLVHALYKRAVRDNELPMNHVSGLAADLTLFARGEPKGKTIPPENMPAVWKSMEMLHPSVRDFLRVAYFTGWRKSVLGSLQWSRVNLEKKTYFIKKKQRGGNDTRDLDMPISDILWDRVFKPRLGDIANGATWILPSNAIRGRPMKTPSQCFATIEAATGLKKLSAHVFRYAFITAAEKSVSLLHASVLAMHSPRVARALLQTLEYVVIPPDELRASSNKVCEVLLAQALTE
jgi:integrase